MPVPSAQQLRNLGPAGLTELLTLRPEVLGPPAPRSLAELSARLGHPVLLSLALARLGLPELQAAEALAALGPAAGRAALDGLLGIDGPAGGQALDRVLGSLAARGMLAPGRCRLDPDLEAGWPQPLDLGPRVEDVLSVLTVTDLQAVLSLWGHGHRAGTRKSDLVSAAYRLLTEPDAVRAMAASAPAPLPEQLVQAAYGRHQFSHWGYVLPHHSRFRQDRVSPNEWAMFRLLLVADGRTGTLRMPAEVALALRGAGWHAPFDPAAPPVAWQPVPAEVTRRSAGAAGADLVRLVSDLLRATSGTPLTLLKRGGVGAREIRRLARQLGAEPEPVRFVLALAHHIGLVAGGGAGVTGTAAGEEWLHLEPARALAVLVAGWMDLPDIPLDSDDLAWAPLDVPTATDLRRVVLGLLAGSPGQAPAGPGKIVGAVYWTMPTVLGRGLSGNVGAPTAPCDAAGPAGVRTVEAVLAEAELLGVTGAGAISPAGVAALTGGGVDAVEAAFGADLGSAQRSVVLQVDLTATVLGHPAADLAALLDLSADREARSSANVWRFGAASVRRALDAGLAASDLVAELAAAAGAEVPQTLRYLIEDTGRRHGRLRAGGAGCYVRSEDAGLLAEVAADRRLRRLDLRLLAPTVLVSSAPVAEVMAALRSAGHGPVEEGAGGAAVPARKAAPSARPRPRTARPQSPRREPTDPARVAATLLAGADSANRLLDVGQTVIDIASLRELAQVDPLG